MYLTFKINSKLHSQKMRMYDNGRKSVEVKIPGEGVGEGVDPRKGHIREVLSSVGNSHENMAYGGTGSTTPTVVKYYDHLKNKQTN